MNKKLLITLVVMNFCLISIINPLLIKEKYLLNAQQINPPKLLKTIVTDCSGLPIDLATISIDFKPMGLTNAKGEFCFENNGGIIAISKPGFITKIMQLPSYWQGDINITLYKTYDSISQSKTSNYSRKLILESTELTNKKVLIFDNYLNYNLVETDSNGTFNIYFKEKSKLYLFYIEQKQNSLYLFFSELKEKEDDSILILDYNVYNSYKINLESSVLPYEIILKGKNSFYKVPYYKESKILSPYTLFIGSNDYSFFENYDIFFLFSLNFSNYMKITKYNFNKIEKDYFSIKSLIFNFYVKPDRKNQISNSDFSQIINQSIDFDKEDNFLNQLLNLIDFHVVNNEYIQFNLNGKDIIKLAKISVFENNSKLVLESYFYDFLRLPILFFEKKYSVYIEIFPNLFYDNIINDINILSKNSYFGLKFKIW